MCREQLPQPSWIVDYDEVVRYICEIVTILRRCHGHGNLFVESVVEYKTSS